MTAFVVDRPLAREVEATTFASARFTRLCLALTVGCALVAGSSQPDEVLQSAGLALAGATSLAALLYASFDLRAHRTPSWTTSQRDPFLAFAAAIVVLVAPHLTALVGSPASNILAPYGWLTGGLAAMFGATGFLVMIRDLTPGRGIDALFLAAIGSTTAGLIGWVAMVSLADAGVISRPPFDLLALAVLDLCVVGVGLQALALRGRARQGCWLFVLAWTFLLVSDVSELLSSATGRPVPAGAMVAAGLMVHGLLAAGAVHPHSVTAAERVVGSLGGLPRLQVGLLGVAVLLGPSVSVVLRQRGALPAVVGVSGVLSLLVVTYLVRLVQGRAAMEHRAHHDELTGLANRRLFAQRAADAVAHARRANGHCAVLFLDLDRFKNVNDSLGHAFGNRLLQAVARRLRGASRAEDTVARLGGDEFVVLLPQLDHPDEAVHAATHLLECFDRPFALNGHQLFASPSIGIAVFPDDGDDAELLLEHADIAMYRAKQRGRRTFCTYEPAMSDKARRQLSLESQMHTAVERGELRLHYQPKIHFPTGRVTGMEALLRWEHPQHGLLCPAEFIPLAEESGLIVPLGEWALQEACRQNQAWVEAGYEARVMAVNLSLRQFQQQHIEDVTARVLRATGMDPRLLELEVTESLAMEDPQEVRATLVELKELGVACSIDDFGTGYSGLSHLAGFPIDKLKIDKSFVATIDEDRDAPLVVAVVALAHGLGLGVVAEGVETLTQLTRLQELGCDEMQGFYFSRPVAPEQFEHLLLLEAAATGVLARPAGEQGTLFAP